MNINSKLIKKAAEKLRLQKTRPKGSGRYFYNASDCINAIRRVSAGGELLSLL